MGNSCSKSSANATLPTPQPRRSLPVVPPPAVRPLRIHRIEEPPTHYLERYTIVPPALSPPEAQLNDIHRKNRRISNVAFDKTVLIAAGIHSRFVPHCTPPISQEAVDTTTTATASEPNEITAPVVVSAPPCAVNPLSTTRPIPDGVKSFHAPSILRDLEFDNHNNNDGSCSKRIVSFTQRQMEFNKMDGIVASPLVERKIYQLQIAKQKDQK